MDWNSRARHRMERKNWREERAWLGRGGLLGWDSLRWQMGSKGVRRVKVANNYWYMGVGGGRCVAGGTWGWNDCYRLGKVKLFVRNEGRAKDMGKKLIIWGNYACRSGIVGVVWVRLDYVWMAIGIFFNLSNCLFVNIFLW